MTGSLHDVDVVLLVTGAGLMPAEVTRLLRLTATHTALPDRLRRFRGESGVWALVDGPTPDTSTLEDRLTRLGTTLAATRGRVEELRERDHAVEIVVRGWAEGIRDLTLSPAVLKSLAEADVLVSFTVRRHPSDVDVFFAEMLGTPSETRDCGEMRGFDYTECRWSPVEVTLQLSHPTLSPAEMTREMRLAPSRETEPGGSRHSPDGFWVVVFSGHPTRLDNPIPTALATLSERGDTLARLVGAGVSAELSIMSAVRDGATLTFDTRELSALADLRVPLHLCVIAK